MRDKIKYFVSGFILAICLTILINKPVESQASTDLQSAGKIVFNNPTTGQEEIVFDAKDQDKLKNSINSNSIDINNLKEFMEEQNELNNSLRDKDTELKSDIDILGDSLGEFTPIIDETTGEITGYMTTIGGADTVFPFKKGIDKVVFRVTVGASAYESHTRVYYKADLYRGDEKIETVDICNNHVRNGYTAAKDLKTWTLN